MTVPEFMAKNAHADNLVRVHLVPKVRGWNLWEIYGLEYEWPSTEWRKGDYAPLWRWSRGVETRSVMTFFGFSQTKM